MNFDFGADPDPAFNFDVDPAFHSDTDTDPACQNIADPDPHTGRMCGNVIVRLAAPEQHSCAGPP
jgi:hypothetical protein